MSISSQGHKPVEVNGPPSNGNGQRHTTTHHDESSPYDIIPSSALAQELSNRPISPDLDDKRPHKKAMIKYKECLRNHAAAIGGNATDGCGEFMAAGEEGTLEALKCSACNCHRNFHRKVTEGESSSECCHSLYPYSDSRKLILRLQKGKVGPEFIGYHTGSLVMHHQMKVPHKIGSNPSEKEEGVGVGVLTLTRPGEIGKKRFRTKFTPEQKEKMLSFAEKAGWKMQKLDESVVQQFCQEIGIKRRVLKVWMHNNKQNLANKNTTSPFSN